LAFELLLPFYFILACTRALIFDVYADVPILQPSAPNGVAAFIGRHDPWYRRHILNPFRSPIFLAPWIRPEDDNRFVEESNARSAQGPGTFLRAMCEHYVRESRDDALFRVNVYLIQGR
jgi:hypothetical protein